MKLGHVGLTAKDSNALSGFYERFLGLHRVAEAITDQTGAMGF